MKRDWQCALAGGGGGAPSFVCVEEEKEERRPDLSLTMATQCKRHSRNVVGEQHAFPPAPEQGWQG